MARALSEKRGGGQRSPATFGEPARAPKAGLNRTSAQTHLVVLKDPERLSNLLDRANVRVGTKEDVLQLRLLLVDLLDGPVFQGTAAGGALRDRGRGHRVRGSLGKHGRGDLGCGRLLGYRRLS